MNGWIGVDLDATLAEYNGWQGSEHIGKPIPLMLSRVKEWLNEGKNVKILTARVSSNNPNRYQSLLSINKWCEKHVGQVLEVTSEKDYGMIELYDDRCKQIIPNTGMLIEEYLQNKIFELENELADEIRFYKRELGLDEDEEDY